jgi:hypothetical protein
MTTTTTTEGRQQTSQGVTKSMRSGSVVETRTAEGNSPVRETHSISRCHPEGRAQHRIPQCFIAGTCGVKEALSGVVRAL